MVVDGFKSYGQRTEINGFDDQFNAITGLNGSGKSNILDAICFLLGITNLSHVRASNLQELVYKNGQAGVTKATVSITFDNRDKKQSPLGYEHYDEVTITRQVVIGGKNKYLINGTNVQNNRVSDLFRSVQLNVNNPHFLIMQGRITKVLNMKPPEILAMLEEAAGTRMYESKKQQAEKTIEKKDAKLKEINSILDEEINPTLAKLKEEKSAYAEYQRIQRELEHLKKIHIAWRFICAEEESAKLATEHGQVEIELAQVKTTINEGEENISSLEGEIRQLIASREDDTKAEVDRADQDLKEKEKEKAKATSHMKQLQDNIKQEERKQKNVEKGLQDDNKAMELKKKSLEGMQEMYDKLRESDASCQQALKAAQDRMQAISLGQFATDTGESATLQDQLIKTKADVAAAETELKTASSKIKNNTEQLKKKQIEMKKTEAVYKKDSSSLGKFEADVADIERKLQRIDYQEGSYERMENEQRTLKMEINSAKSKVEGIEHRHPRLAFQYSDPYPNFDRRQVHGVAAKLFTVVDQNFCQALTTAAGGKLYNVVLETEEIGKSLLKNGRLQKSTTFIPLNKIKPYLLNQRVIAAAKRIGGKDNVWWAAELVRCDRHFEPAVNFLFGPSLICRDLDVANKIAFHPEVDSTCITLAGEKVSPGGDMSGGAVSRQAPVLEDIFNFRDIETDLTTKQEQMKMLSNNLRNLSAAAEQWTTLSQQLELKQAELDMTRNRLKQTLHHQLKEEVEKLQQANDEVTKGVDDAKALVKEGNAKIKDLEYKINNAEELKAKEMKTAEAEVKKCKTAAEKSKKNWSGKEQEEQSIKLELDTLSKSIESGQEQLRCVAEAIKEWKKEIETFTSEVDKAVEEVKVAEKIVKEKRDQLAKKNEEINTRTNAKEKLTKKVEEAKLQVQELNHKVSKAQDDLEHAKIKVNQMLEDYQWIEGDRHSFGLPNTIYDFKQTNPSEAAKRIHKLEGTSEKLSKTVNTRAMNMLSKAEEQYEDLMKKKEIVENDKAKIVETIQELDKMKKEALRKAWDQVNKDFGSIFSSVLPGTSAKLQPPEGQDVLDGLEVKVAFGGVWKETLTELSGGQRSLVALSLILSLLLFKPAPLYILDEVDAALDLSHTQNIGHMLKTHFKHSQFIVVSLKDGMFNNANVLYRTKFVDGMSTVTRTTNQQNMARK